MTQSVRRQGMYERFEGTKAEQLKAGDVLIWNFGYKSKVLNIEQTKSGKSLNVEVLCLGSNIKAIRKLRKTTLVALEERR